MEQFQDPTAIETQQKLKKLEELAPQAYDYAMTALDMPRDEFFAALDILNSKENQPPAEGLYEEVHFPTSADRNLSAKVFENGRISFRGNWQE